MFFLEHYEVHIIKWTFLTQLRLQSGSPIKLDNKQGVDQTGNCKNGDQRAWMKQQKLPNNNLFNASCVGLFGKVAERGPILRNANSTAVI